MSSAETRGPAKALTLRVPQSRFSLQFLNRRAELLNVAWLSIDVRERISESRTEVLEVGMKMRVPFLSQSRCNEKGGGLRIVTATSLGREYDVVAATSVDKPLLTDRPTHLVNLRTQQPSVATRRSKDQALDAGWNPPVRGQATTDIGFTQASKDGYVHIVVLYGAETLSVTQIQPASRRMQNAVEALLELREQHVTTLNSDQPQCRSLTSQQLRQFAVATADIGQASCCPWNQRCHRCQTARYKHPVCLRCVWVLVLRPKLNLRAERAKPFGLDGSPRRGLCSLSPVPWRRASANMSEDPDGLSSFCLRRYCGQCQDVLDMPEYRVATGSLDDTL